MRYLLIIFYVMCASFVDATTSHFMQLAKAAMQKRQFSQALSYLEVERQHNAEDIETLLSCATAHFFLHHYREAAEFYEKVLQKNPRHINAAYNCATMYSRCGEFDKAIAHFETVYNYFQDDSVKGALLKHYLRSRKWKKLPTVLEPDLWYYDKNIHGKTILLDMDKPGNGFGDCINFLQYSRILHQAGANVIAKVPNPLKILFQGCPYLTHVVTNSDLVPPFDASYSICIASLLYKMRNQISMRSPQRPYLFVPEQLQAFWQKQLAADSNFKIGLCWKSNAVKDRATGRIIESPRSISLDLLSHLPTTGFSYYSLQKMQEIKAPFPLIQFTKDFDESHGRFMDTAALIMNMDLVITVDTSIAHLAGALGKTTWLLLSCESDYRWFTHEKRSPLYPSVFFFRQLNYNDWQPVVEQLGEQLLELKDSQ